MLFRSASSYTFSSIAASWTDLIAIMSCPGETGSSYYGALSFQLNGDTGTNYSTTTVEGNGTSAVSQRQSTQSQTWASGFQATGSTISYMIISNFMNYANASTYKTILNRASGAGMGTSSYVGLWRSTSAITSIKFIEPYGGQFNAGTTIALYGVKSA